jgi:predicted acylesterase/phospholipase RssA
LQEFGVQVDYVGGSGMGAVMGALIALDAPADELIAYAREAFTANVTGDISLVPLTALIKGRRMKPSSTRRSSTSAAPTLVSRTPGSRSSAWRRTTRRLTKWS